MKNSGNNSGSQKFVISVLQNRITVLYFWNSGCSVMIMDEGELDFSVMRMCGKHIQTTRK